MGSLRPRAKKLNSSFFLSNRYGGCPHFAMKHTFHVLILSILIASTGLAEKVRVTADNVNVRGNSNLTSRVMGQVSSGIILEVVTVGDSWLGILPPENVFAWIHGDLLSDGKVTSLRANIRSGPGINYEVITAVAQGAKLTTHDKFADWIQVTPPKGSLVWISKQFTGPAQKAPMTDAAPPTIAEIVAPPSVEVGIAAKPPKPLPTGTEAESTLSRGAAPTVTPAQTLSSAGVTSNMLVQTHEQGVPVSHKGILKKASVVWRRPSRYMLVNPAADAEDIAICYVSGSDPQLESILGRKMTVEGKQYTIQGSRFPLVVANKITVH